ncbi:MAG: hypothetical protein ACP5OY_04035, partial [Halothiobacillaceae bacterium]
RVLLVTFLARARKVTRPLAWAFVRRNKLQSGRKTTSTVVQSRFETGLRLGFARLKSRTSNMP